MEPFDNSDNSDNLDNSDIDYSGLEYSYNLDYSESKREKTEEIEKMFTGIPQVDRNVILPKLNDAELLRLCIASEYVNRTLCNEEFWKTRLINKFGLETLSYKNKNKTFKQYYLGLIYFIEQFNNMSRHTAREIVLEQLMIAAAEGGDWDIWEFLRRNF